MLKNAAVTAALGLGAVLLIRALPLLPILEGVPFSSAVYDHTGKLLRLTTAEDERFRLYTPLGEISPHLAEASLLHEDQFFRSHPGFNPWAFVRSFWHTYLARDRRMGGSTITMQVARLRFGVKSDGIPGKFRQLTLAIWLELAYSKDEILEAYLNLAPYGENVEGAGAASLVYFGKKAGDLSLAEALTLAVIPQNPSKRSLAPGGTDKKALLSARAALFQRWITKHPEDVPERTQLELPLTVIGRVNLPFSAPHFVDRILESAQASGSFRTTLDLAFQRAIERKIQRYVSRKREVGVDNAAALLIDSRTMGVLALAGSADYHSDEISGQVDGTSAKRSPGSATKPFIYALGIQEGLIHPRSLLKDTPRSFGEFNPENFDKEFAGPLSATDALVHSRNIPAVQLVSELDHPTFYEFLKEAEISRLRDADFYGLATALGGVEVTMEELVRLYAALSNGGILRPVRRLDRDLETPGERILSPEASYLVLEMLRENPEPGESISDFSISRSHEISWKTGTSSSFRDAWTAGVWGPYVLAVWLGHFDGHMNQALRGRELAAPLFFEIIDALRLQGVGVPSPTPPGNLNIAKVKVCALSGQIPSPWCKHLVESAYVPGVSPIRICDIHRAVNVDLLTGRRTCPGQDSKNARTQIYEFWPSDILRLFALAGVPRRLPPPPSKDCTANDLAASGLPPQITSPRTGVTYNLRASNSPDNKIAFDATTDADARELHWFVDDEYIGKAPAHSQFLWNARPGTFVVRAVDDHGRADAEIVQVAVVK